MPYRPRAPARPRCSRFSGGRPDRRVVPLVTGEHGRTLAGASEYVIGLSTAPALRDSSIRAVFRATPS